MKKILLFLLITLIVLLCFSAFFWFYETQYIVSKASISRASFSIENSYFFISPLRAKANGQERIRLTIFILNNQGIGVMGKTVLLQKNNNLTIETIQSLTDSYGKAIFDISSTLKGEYYLNVTIDGIPLKQKARLSYD